MKKIRIYMVAAIILASFHFADAAPSLARCAEPFQSIKRPPPPPDPLHLFSKRPAGKRPVKRKRTGKGITFPKIKLPPHPPRPKLP